jgi:hypothetical protein
MILEETGVKGEGVAGDGVGTAVATRVGAAVAAGVGAAVAVATGVGAAGLGVAAGLGAAVATGVVAGAAVGTGVIAGVAGIAVGAGAAVGAGVPGAGVSSSPQAAMNSANVIIATRAIAGPFLSICRDKATISYSPYRKLTNSREPAMP